MTSSASDARYQIRIQLKHVDPPIWRDVIVPANINLGWLHELIQEAMGWMDLQLHQFTHQGVHYVCDIEEDFSGGEDEAIVSLGELLKKVGDQLSYDYDLGNGWEHRVSLKKILPADAETPIYCLQGEGACPPESCGGGPFEYMELRALSESHGELSEEDQERLDLFELEAAESFEQADVDEVNETFAKIRAHVAERGGFGVGGAPLFDGIFKPHELDDEDDDLADFMDFDEEEEKDFEEFIAGLTGEAEASEAVLPMSGHAHTEEGDEEFPEPYTELDPADCAAFKAAMEGAGDLRGLEPWKRLKDCDIFGVEDPETGGIHIVSVLGAGKDIFSLHMHRAPYALGFWREALNDPGGMGPDAVLHRSSMIEVEFCNKADMEEPDIALYERVGLDTPPRGRKRWVRFRTYRPRTYPWFPLPEELSQLDLGMRLCDRYLELMAAAANPESFLMEPDADKGLPPSLKVFRLSDGAKPSETDKWTLSDVGIDWDSCEAPSEPYQPSEFELHQLAELPKQAGAWELGAIFLPAPAMTATGPVIPVMAIALDVTMEQPPQPHLSTNLEASPTQVLWDALKIKALDANALPSEIHVSTDAAESSLQAFAELSGVKIRRVESLPLLGGLFQTMLQGM